MHFRVGGPDKPVRVACGLAQGVPLRETTIISTHVSCPDCRAAMDYPAVQFTDNPPPKVEVTHCCPRCGTAWTDDRGGPVHDAARAFLDLWLDAGIVPREGDRLTPDAVEALEALRKAMKGGKAPAPKTGPAAMYDEAMALFKRLKAFDEANPSWRYSEGLVKARASIRFVVDDLAEAAKEARS